MKTILKISLRDWKFQAGLNISSEPPAKGPIFVGNSEGGEIEKNLKRGWTFQARFKVKRD